MVRVLITGGTGFLGRNLVNHLLKKDFELTLLVRNKRKASIFKEVQFLEGDLTRSLKFPECDVVVHLASMLKEPRTEREKKKAFKINVKGTKNVLEASSKAGIPRIIYTSTDLVYKQGIQIFNEKTPLEPYNFYAKTKLEGENILRNGSIDATILRMANMYGPCQTKGMIAEYIQSFLKNEDVVAFRNKSKDYLYVSDAVEFIEKVLKKNAFGIFNVGTGISTNSTKIAEILRKKLNSKSKISIELLKNSMFTLHDPSKARKTFNWKHRVSIEEGLEKTVRWWLR